MNGAGRVREGARQTMAWLHGWCGMLVGWVLFVMCLAGTLTLFREEIGRWARPESVAIAAPADAIVAATGWLQRAAPGAHAWYLVAPDARTNSVAATWDRPDGYVTRALDPVTGAPAVRETLGGDFFYRLHFELELPYPWGRLIASAAAMAMLVALVSGIVAHRRIFRDFFTFRGGKGQRSWLDGHNALGVFSLPFHLMITFTGLVALASLSMPWGIVANYGNDSARMFRELQPGAVDRPATQRRVPLAPISPMLAEAARRFGDGAIGRVTVANPGDAAAVVTVYQSDDGQLAATPRVMSFDGATGRVLADARETRPGVRTYAVVYGLHMARFASGVMRWLYALGGLMLTLAIATGLCLWVAKRQERAPLSRANRVVARANAGVLAGAPAAFALFLCANRLLPLDLAGRSEAEVAVALWGALAALLLGLALPPRRGWPLLLGLAAGLTALAAVLDLVQFGARGRPPLFLVTDLVLLLVALGLAATARLSLRGRAVRTRVPRVAAAA